MPRFIRITSAIGGKIVKHTDGEILIEVLEHVAHPPALWMTLFEDDPRKGGYVKRISEQLLTVKKGGLIAGKNNK